MLVLTRKRNEAILIGPDIRVVVVRVDGGYVRIGIEAPSGVKVLREELVDGGEDRDDRAAPGPAAHARLPRRSECRCICHQGGGALHVMPCCTPD